MSAHRSARAFITLTVLIWGSTASAAAIAVSLDLQGGYGNSTLKACGITHHYTLYRRGQPNQGRRRSFAGTNREHPDEAQAQAVPQRKLPHHLDRRRTCRDQRSLQRHAPAQRPDSYFARAHYEGPTKVKSAKRYFRAT